MSKDDNSDESEGNELTNPYSPSTDDLIDNVDSDRLSAFLAEAFQRYPDSEEPVSKLINESMRMALETDTIDDIRRKIEGQKQDAELLLNEIENRTEFDFDQIDKRSCRAEDLLEVVKDQSDREDVTLQLEDWNPNYEQRTFDDYTTGTVEDDFPRVADLDIEEIRRGVDYRLWNKFKRESYQIYLPLGKNPVVQFTSHAMALALSGDELWWFEKELWNEQQKMKILREIVFHHPAFDLDSSDMDAFP